MAARRYLEEFGARIADNGYAVIPIVPGAKRPYGNKWPKYDGTREGVEDWISSGKGSFGVGIKAKDTPGVDIDVRDPEIVSLIKAKVIDIAGATLERVGLPPKTLLPYRAEEFFPKVDTGFWIDPKGRESKVEILADGQQFVAAHIHPDTGKPYQWLNGKSVLNTPRSALPLLTADLAEEIKQAAISIFLDHGYVKKTNAVTRLTATGFDADDPFAAVRAKTEITDEELERKLMLVPNASDYEMWFFVGMSLFHQYDGNEQGLRFWHQWSATAANYDESALDKHWPTFNIEQKDRPPLTARFIIKKAQEAEAEISAELIAKVYTGIAESTTLPELEKVCEIIKSTQFSLTVREVMVGRVKERFKDITKIMPRIGVVRDMTRYESRETHAMPGWLKNWVYCQMDDTLFHTHDRRRLARPSFNASFSRLMLTPGERMEGKSVPETQPSDAALNLYQIPVVYNHQYMPGLPDLYSLNGISYVNSYSDQDIPELPGEFSPVELQAIEIVQAHMVHLISNARDRRLFLDFMTYIVQNPGKRINWAVLLQGAEGDGKSFFGSLMCSVLGLSNVNEITGQSLEEKYNPWAEGGLLCFVEDVRLHGLNRFDAINKLKPMLTNRTVSIRRMNVDLYVVVNTMSYILTSNSKDAMPVGEEDSRIFPIFTRFQTSAKLREFKEANPDYYRRLFSVLSFGGAIRKWFLERELSADFDADQRAPESSHRHEMVQMNRTAEQQVLADCLEDSELADFSELLLDSGKIADQFMGTDALPPATKALNRLLSVHGFSYLGRWKINGERRQYWSMKPEAWSPEDLERGQQIRDYLDPAAL